MPTDSPRPCAGFLGYCADATGAVYSQWRQTPASFRGGTRSFIDPEKFRRLKPCMSKGYFVVGCKAAGKSRAVPVHTLVCSAFHGPRPKGDYECRHLDGTPSNNAPSNLAWGTPKKNAEDRRRHGRDLLGEDAAGAKLTKSQVIEIRASAASKWELAAKFNVTDRTIRDIRARRKWRSVA